MSEILYGPVPHSEAADFIRSKPAVSRAVFDQMVPEVRARTFLVTGMVPLDIAQKLRDRIADLPAGGDWDKIKREVADSLTPFFKHPGVEKGGGTVDSDEARAAAERRAELLLRTHGYQAYAASQYNVLERQKDVFPYWRYQTAQDDRVRDSHAALEGVVLPANDPFWQTHFPPWDFNCRCTVVPLSEADAAEIRGEDAQKPADQRSILTTEQRSRMNTDGTLLRGPNEIVDVRSPRQKRDGDGYAWQPGDLRLPLSTIKERYSPEVWSAFETFAKGTALGGDYGRTTLYTWLKDPAAGKHGESEPAPAPSHPGDTAPARTSPVSRVFALAGSRSAARPVMEATLAAIDRVHDDGTLPEMKLTSKPVPGALGHFRASTREIAVSPKGLWPRMTASHEAGHMLDWFALGAPGKFASELHPDLAAWRTAVANSAAVKGLVKGTVDGMPISGREYFLRKHEIWARSYSQYIAQKSGDVEQLAQLGRIRAVPGIGKLIQWDDDDFKPIAAAIDDLFKKKGWIA